jgi:hypothetical protein
MQYEYYSICIYDSIIGFPKELNSRGHIYNDWGHGSGFQGFKQNWDKLRSSLFKNNLIAESLETYFKNNMRRNSSPSSRLEGKKSNNSFLAFITTYETYFVFLFALFPQLTGHIN